MVSHMTSPAQATRNHALHLDSKHLAVQTANSAHMMQEMQSVDVAADIQGTPVRSRASQMVDTHLHRLSADICVLDVQRINDWSCA